MADEEKPEKLEPEEEKRLMEKLCADDLRDRVATREGEEDQE